MNRDTFLKVLKEKTAEEVAEKDCNGHWWASPTYGTLRTKDDQCPLTFVANHHDANNRFCVSEWELAAGALGMDRGLAEEIVSTADGCGFEAEYSEALREELVEACDPTLYGEEEGG